MEKKKVYEVRSNFYDEVVEAWAIDCWFDDDENSEGETVAYVSNDGSITWRNPLYEGDNAVMSEIVALMSETIRPALVEQLEMLDQNLTELKKCIKQ